MPKTKLTDAAIQRIKKPPTGQVDHFDAGYPGLALRVSYGGRKTFVHFYRHPATGKLRRRNIGAYPAKSLKDAHEAYRDDRGMLDRGLDPIEEREGVRAANVAKRRDAQTYKEAVEDYYVRFQVGERGNTTADEVKRALLKEGAEWHNRAVASITAREIRRRLEEIRDGDQGGGIKARPYLANRFHAYLSRFFAWCAEPGIELVEGSPIAGIKKPWDGEETRSRAFTDDEIRALWNSADTLGAYAGGFLRVLMLTGKRKNALAAMRRDEIDDDGVWTPPQDARRRRRNKRAHVVPLARAAQDIVDGLDEVEGNEHVFIGRRTGGHLDPGTPLQTAIKEASGVDDFFFHAVRHTVETRLAELRVQPHIRDLLLDHAWQRGAGAGLDHHDYLPEMRSAMEAWADKLREIVTGEPDRKVVRLGKRGA